jgi:hypothetical protein
LGVGVAILPDWSHRHRAAAFRSSLSVSTGTARINLPFAFAARIIFLATMLGTDRPSVTVAAGVLQKEGMIEYTRGSVRILNRKQLESFACECYALIKQYNS